LEFSYFDISWNFEYIIEEMNFIKELQIFGGALGAFAKSNKLLDSVAKKEFHKFRWLKKPKFQENYSVSEQIQGNLY
jgi:hypothetical protein